MVLVAWCNHMQTGPTFFFFSLFVFLLTYKGASPSLSHTLSLSPSPGVRTCPLPPVSDISFALSLSLCPSLSLSLSLSLSHTHTHIHTHTLSLSLLTYTSVFSHVPVTQKLMIFFLICLMMKISRNSVDEVVLNASCSSLYDMSRVTNLLHERHTQ